MSKKKRRLLAKSIVLGLMLGTTAFYPTDFYAFAAGNDVVANNILPTDAHNIIGNIKIDAKDNTMNIAQADKNGVITWGNFSIGANATVNFNGQINNFNTLNYVTGKHTSQIYGNLNANNNGNIYLVNPNGVQIGNSAQINVGSLYVSNKTLDDSKIAQFNGSNINTLVNQNITNNAELMSLGNINATKVTFAGDRIVFDLDRAQNRYTDAQKEGNISIDITSGDTDNLVLGYTKGTSNANQTIALKDSANNPLTADDYKYIWVKNYADLQAVNDDVNKNYALRNAIDAVVSKEANHEFTPIGTFTGKFDGLDYGIYGLTINGKNNVGLFGKTDGATIRNLRLIGGSITGNTSVGALVGEAQNHTTIENIVSSVDVTGGEQVGGIVGTATDSKLSGLVNTGTTSGSANVGSLIGYMQDSELETKASESGSYSLGAVKGIRTDGSAEDTSTLDNIAQNNSSQIGGLVGSAIRSKIGNADKQTFNQLDVSGGHEVGGIVGKMVDTELTNVANYGKVNSTGYIEDIHKYHTTLNNGDDDGFNHKIAVDNGIATQKVYVANVGGIAGISTDSTINKAINTGDVQTATANTDTSQYTGVDTSTGRPASDGEAFTFYVAGNVGGIVGKAENTALAEATNEENHVYGSHNVGGIAGALTGSSTITQGINDGSTITATGARGTYDGMTSEFVREKVRKYEGNETYILGNMGGIAGYLTDDAKIGNSTNRGTIQAVELWNVAQNKSEGASNAGGIVGKIDKDTTETLANIKDDANKATIWDTYNTGSVNGYTAIGGIAGFMYNGEITQAYNTGKIETIRIAKDLIDPINMGGIVGDATEQTKANALLYNVFNKGQIGDSNFVYGGRHVGGVAGRFSGVIDSAYNNANIYNSYNVVGGVVGWWYTGDVSNVYNTGNITVSKGGDGGVLAGGVIGGAGTGGRNTTSSTMNLANAYNLGVIRSFATGKDGRGVAGIVGGLRSYDGNNGILNIQNVYTNGEIYTGNEATSGYILGSITDKAATVNIGNARYIERNANSTVKDPFNVNNAVGTNNNAGTVNADTANENIQGISYSNRHDRAKWESFINATDANTSDSQYQDSEGVWRIYEETTPILNAFAPNTMDKGYFTEAGKSEGIGSSNLNNITVQYGNAYDPFLTIVKNNNANDLNVDWQKSGIGAAEGLAVYNSGLNIVNFNGSNGTTLPYGGTIFSEGTTKLSGDADVYLGSSSKIYGENVEIDFTGNSFKDTGSIVAYDGDVNISADDVELYGKVQASTSGETTSIAGILASMDKNGDRFAGMSADNIIDKTQVMPEFENLLAETKTANKNGNINIEAENTAKVLFGTEKQGYLNAGGNINVLAGDTVYVDSDIKVGGDITLGGVDKAHNAEAVLDISNIGYNVTNSNQAKDDFLTHWENGTNKINFYTDDAKITVDMWDSKAHNFDFTKFDNANGNTIADHLAKLNVNYNSEAKSARDIFYTWIDTGEQLAAIQKYASDTSANILNFNYALKNDIDASGISDYKSIGQNASYNGTFDGRNNRIVGLNSQTGGIFDTVGENGQVKDLKVYSSNFTANAQAENAIGSGIGAIANVNLGTIDNINTFGNEITSNGKAKELIEIYEIAAGGIAGINAGTVQNAYVADVVKTDSAINNPDGETADTAFSVAGGAVGINVGTVDNVGASSAVISTGNGGYSLGGIVGVNAANRDNQGNNEPATIANVSSKGVTSGIYSDTVAVPNVGGIVGANTYTGTIDRAYNEGVVTGKANVGGIVGWNQSTGKVDGKGATIQDIVNAGTVTGTDGVGGLIGSNGIDKLFKPNAQDYTFVETSVTNGRNTGTVTGLTAQDGTLAKYTGGLVGVNGANSTLTDLTNDLSGEVRGNEAVGGIAGINYGTITSGNAELEADSLINSGSVTGHKYVGGVVGENYGTIEHTISNSVLQSDANGAEFFGGIAGLNGNGAVNANGVVHNTAYKGTISNSSNGGTITTDEVNYVGGITGQNTGLIEKVTNDGEVKAENATNVGGITGVNGIDNDKTIGKIRGDISNNGTVNGKANVGGIAGVNFSESFAQDITLYNAGKVVATDGGAGGIFYDNRADLANITLKNDAKVSGSNYVGGVIGTNSGTIAQSNIINTVNGTVTGMLAVGGLVGLNDGTLTGGRDADDNYYKYQIYNNGKVEGSSLVGGLIGDNTGNLTAGYNTGSVKGNTFVGGIAGRNYGKIDQVFNTLADGNTITAEYGVVGGLVGINNGSITNAYNSSKINGADTIAQNNGTAEFVYGLNGTDAADYDRDIWKIYDSNKQNPLLKVFLTKAVFKPNADHVFTYNGKAQGVKGFEQDKTNNRLVVIGTDGEVLGYIYVKDNDGAHNLSDYLNTTKDTASSDSADLINGNQFTNAGKGYELLFSEQINTSDSSNPNYLGFDLSSSADFDPNNPHKPTPEDEPKFDIDKKKLNITLTDVERTYGDKNLSSGQYDFHVDGWVTGEDYSDKLSIKDGTIADGGLSTETNRTTNNAGKYSWQAEFAGIDDLSNYEIGEIQDGVSTVNKAKLNVDLTEVWHTYGSQDVTKGEYNFNMGKLTNGDSEADLNLSLNKNSIKDGGLVYGDANKQTQSAGDYTWTGTLDGTDMMNNYDITINEGKSHVDKAKITITVDNKEVSRGEKPDYTGKVDKPVNGDSEQDIIDNFGVKDPHKDYPKGEYEDEIGVWIDGKFYQKGERVDNENYDITIDWGKLTVTDKDPSPKPEPEIVPDDKWDYLYTDNPWDKDRNFRERKAEFNYVDGGMNIIKNDEADLAVFGDDSEVAQN